MANRRLSDRQAAPLWQQLSIATIPALVTGCLAFFAAQYDRFFPPTIAADAQKEAPVPAIPSPQSAFGNWETRQQDAMYLAESDGFVMAMTAGNDPANYADILMGPEQGTLAVCSRMRRYDGAMCAVPQGWFWKVRENEEQPGTIVVRWLPVSLRNSH